MANPPRPTGSVDADELGRREFTRSRKGWDPIEVRAHLLTMAEEIKRLQGLEFDLETKVSSLEREVAERSELDESRLTQMLGEETARVLEAARQAAAEVRARAEAEALELTSDATARAEQTVAEAEELRRAAAGEADELVAEARRRIDEMMNEARRNAEELRSDAETDAAATRDRADRSAQDKVAEAEADAERIRHAAQSAREEADAYAERMRREADQHSTTVRNEADRHAEAVRTDADAAAERTREEAGAAAERRAEEAAEAAEAEIESAREQGRRMVQEAREARERMLRDLAERRRTARQQLEALRAGRERLLEAFGAARAAFDDATDELTDALPAARAAADAAARVVDDDLEAAVAELDAAIGGDEGAAPEETPASTPDEAVEEQQPEPSDRNPATTMPGDAAGGAAEESPTRLRLVAPEPPAVEGGDDDDTGEGDPADAHGSGHDHDDEDDSGGQVEAIFARLRAGRSDDDAEGPSEDAEPVGGDHGDHPAGDPVRLPEGRVIDLGRTPGPEGVGADADDAPQDGDAAADDEATGIDVEPSWLDLRDDALGDTERAVARRLKRALSDQENALLDRLQRSRKHSVTAEVLDDPAAAANSLWGHLEGELADAVAAGATFLEEGHDVAADADALTAQLRTAVDEWVATPLRDRLERTIDDGVEVDEAPDRFRAVYREWKGEKVAELAGDLVTLAFNRGILAAAAPGAAHCWIVDHGGLPCPDAEDNHLAGPVAAGEEYPTGHTVPPAHPGCRCLLAPTPR